MMQSWIKQSVTIAAVAMFAGSALTDSALAGLQFELVTGVAPGTSPGPTRVVPTTDGGSGFFTDGQRLGGTPSAAAITPLALPYIQQPNQYGSLSFMFRRGSIQFGGPAIAYESIDYLGGPRLDLDGDLGNGSRSLIPVSGQNSVAMPGTGSFIELTPNYGGGSIALNHFDATSNNLGASANQAPTQLVSLNTLAGTSTGGAPGSAINSDIDTRTGQLTPFTGTSTTLQGVHQVSDLGFEFWQDSLFGNPGSPTADNLGTIQSLGSLRGWLVEKDGSGNWPTLAGEGLGSTLWPQVDTSQVGVTFDRAHPNAVSATTATIANGSGPDVFTAAGNGGLALTDYSGDLGTYLDTVVIPGLSPNAKSFVYLEAAGFGMNNSGDPTIVDAVGYDVVLVGQYIPEPGTLVLMAIGGALVTRRSRRDR